MTNYPLMERIIKYSNAIEAKGFKAFRIYLTEKVLEKMKVENLSFFHEKGKTDTASGERLHPNTSLTGGELGLGFQGVPLFIGIVTLLVAFVERCKGSTVR